MVWELRRESVSTVPYRTGSLPEAPRMYIIREQWLAYAFRWLLHLVDLRPRAESCRGQSPQTQLPQNQGRNISMPWLTDSPSAPAWLVDAVEPTEGESLRALTVKGELADALVDGVKGCENRSWPIPRGPLLILL